MMAENTRIVLASRPQGLPKQENFRIEKVPVPTPSEGEVLLKTSYISLDPYVRGRMNESPGYATPMKVDDVIVGGTVCRVEESNADAFQVGDVVLAYTGWQTYAVVSSKTIRKLPDYISQPQWALGVLGMPGLTAWHGLMKIGKPRAGETVVVSAASGAVGSLVGQLSKIQGCHVVGVASGTEKCRHVVEDLKFDACIDRNASDFAGKLKEACPNGIDVYFENVGGDVSEAVLPLLNQFARVPVCGLISWYNQDRSKIQGPLAEWMHTILSKRLLVQGFIVSDHPEDAEEFEREVSKLLREGRIHYREHIVDGLLNAPDTFLDLFKGANHGKLIIKMD